MAIIPDATRFFDPGSTTPQPISIELRRVPGQDKEEWFLTKRIAYRARQFELRGDPPIVVPHDVLTFRTDLTSVPTMFTWLVPRTGRHLPAALVHDALTPPSNGDWDGPTTVTQLEADCVFREAMADLGTPFLRRWLVWSAVSTRTAWHVSKMRAVLGYLGLVVIAVLGCCATLDLIDAGQWLPWMGERPWWLELATGAAMAVLIPLVVSLVWPLGTRKAGAIVGVALAVLLHVTVMVAAVTVAYLAAEYLVERVASQIRRMAFRYLWTPLPLGPATARNRIVFSAHLTNYARDGKPTDQHAAYYGARAAGGAGLIITEEHSTHPTDWPYEKLIHGFHRDVIPGYRTMTAAVHRHGVPIFAQINHNGGQASSMYSRLPVWAPSPVADPLFREVPKAVTHAEIDEVVAGYALVAEHCAEGGFDGIELQCSHSSIVRGFLSPATNLRTDEYGGSIENRARLLVDIVAAVRRVVGNRLALGVRLCGDELIEGGTTIDDAVRIAEIAEATGQVDYVNTSIGVATASLFMIEASMHIPPGYALFIPSAFRKAIDLPVVGVGRFKDPQQAERALAEGHCDLVGVVRGQIADADFAAKARAGATDDIRLCLSCNQECVGRMGLNRWLGCIENPRTGRESHGIGIGRQAARRARVMVVGAGPAGLQAAIAAARNGHDVTVCEKEVQAGGQVRIAASVPNRAELGDMVRNQLAECRRRGVTIEYGVSVWPGLVDERRPDHVIVATGAEPARPWWVPGDGSGGRVADVREILDGSAPDGGPQPGESVVVVDEIGFHHATSVAELLADRGCAVEIVTNGMVVGQDLGITLDMENWWMRATAKGIVQSTDLVPMGLVDGELTLLHHPTGVNTTRRPHWVVLAVPPQPVEWLYRDLRAAGWSVERVGDCVAPRRAHAAVIEGERAGAAV